MPSPVPHNRIQIKERREDVLVLLTKGMKGYEIAKELGVDASTVSRDIQYLISQSHNYLNTLAKEALPFMYQTSIEGIRNVLKECWSIYTIESNKEITATEAVLGPIDTVFFGPVSEDELAQVEFIQYPQPSVFTTPKESLESEINILQNDPTTTKFEIERPIECSKYTLNGLPACSYIYEI